MSAYDPPTEDLPIFDSALFSADTDTLTIAKANSLYLKYPTAQGTENLQDINVGGTTTATGLITANGGLTMGGSNNITLKSSAGAPTATQLGYVITGTNSNLTGQSGNKIVSTLTIPTAGVYILSFMFSTTTNTIPSTTLRYNFVGTNVDTTNCHTKIQIGATRTYNSNGTQIVNATASTYTINLNESTTTISSVSGVFKATRIA